MTSAKNFIKQYGWGKSSVIVFESIGHGANTFYDTQDELYYGQINNIRVSVTELKQYVDAWELVNRFGGLFESKKYIDDRILPELSRSIELVEVVNEF